MARACPHLLIVHGKKMLLYHKSPPIRSIGMFAGIGSEHTWLLGSCRRFYLLHLALDLILIGAELDAEMERQSVRPF
jgi:hypothetical protein